MKFSPLKKEPTWNEKEERLIQAFRKLRGYSDVEIKIDNWNYRKIYIEVAFPNNNVAEYERFIKEFHPKVGDPIGSSVTDWMTKKTIQTHFFSFEGEVAGFPAKGNSPQFKGVVPQKQEEPASTEDQDRAQVEYMFLSLVSDAAKSMAEEKREKVIKAEELK